MTRMNADCADRSRPKRGLGLQGREEFFVGDRARLGAPEGAVSRARGQLARRRQRWRSRLALAPPKSILGPLRTGTFGPSGSIRVHPRHPRLAVAVVVAVSAAIRANPRFPP